MVSNIQNSSGSVDDILKYHTKEFKKYKETFFNHRSQFLPDDAHKILKKGNTGMRKNECKFFHLLIAPSKNELQLMDDESLRNYGIEVMKNYANNFGKNYTIEDFDYFISLERDRKVNDRKGMFEKRNAKGLVGLKEGDQRHLHIVVKRRLREKNGNSRINASPLSNYKNISEKSKVSQGFNRNHFKTLNEQSFDKMFSYNRSEEETFLFASKEYKKTEQYAESVKFVKFFKENKQEINEIFPNLKFSKLKKQKAQLYEFFQKEQIIPQKQEEIQEPIQNDAFLSVLRHLNQSCEELYWFIMEELNLDPYTSPEGAFQYFIDNVSKDDTIEVFNRGIQKEGWRYQRYGELEPIKEYFENDFRQDYGLQR